jgi:hypothetical protein
MPQQNADQQWLEDEMQKSLTDLLENRDGLTSRFCNDCGRAWFFLPDSPTECPHCKPPTSG